MVMAQSRRRSRPHLTLDGYLIGFGLSVILTAIPFGLVMSGVLESKNATAFAITILAVAQIVVHMVYLSAPRRDAPKAAGT